MAVHEQELVGILLAANLDHRQQARHPALAQPRLHAARDRRRAGRRRSSASPSGWLMQTTGTAGLRPIDSAVGAPQIEVQMPS